MNSKIKYGLDSVSNFHLLGFATGSYKNTCNDCGEEFFGDKRSTQCLECAISTSHLAIKMVEEYNNDGT